MTSLKQNIRSVLAEVETFLVETLKGVKLSGNVKDGKDRLLERVRQLLEDIDPGASAGSREQDASNGSFGKTSGGGESGSGSFGTNAEEEVVYTDDIPKIAIKELKNILQSGLLDKKKRAALLTKGWDGGLYCVVSKNVFYIYKKQTDSKQKEAFSLSGYEFREAPNLEKDAAKKDTCFELVKMGAPTHQFRAGSAEGLVHWQDAINKGIQAASANDEDDGDVYEILDTMDGRSHNIQHQRAADDSDDGECYENIDDDVKPIAKPSRPNAPLPALPTDPPPKNKASPQVGSYMNVPSTTEDKQFGKRSSAAGSKIEQEAQSRYQNLTSAAPGENKPGNEPGNYMNLLKENSGKGGQPGKRLSATSRPPMIDLYQDCESQDGAARPPSLKETLKKLGGEKKETGVGVRTSTSGPGATTGKKSVVFKAAGPQSHASDELYDDCDEAVLPKGRGKISASGVKKEVTPTGRKVSFQTSVADELYDDCEEAVLPKGKGGERRSSATSANPNKGRDLPGLPAKTGLKAENKNGNNPGAPASETSEEADQPAKSFKDLKKMFQ